VKEYAARHDTFPNESTGDQFFDENQFESYRELGRHIGRKVFLPLVGSIPGVGGGTPAQIRDTLLERLAVQLRARAEQAAGKDTPAPPG
jgi:hypothetical protein